MQDDWDNNGAVDGAFDEAENEWPSSSVSAWEPSSMFKKKYLLGLCLDVRANGIVGLRWWCLGLSCTPPYVVDNMSICRDNGIESGWENQLRSGRIMFGIVRTGGLKRHSQWLLRFLRRATAIVAHGGVA